jgi:hypothetical protein
VSIGPVRRPRQRLRYCGRRRRKTNAANGSQPGSMRRGRRTAGTKSCGDRAKRTGGTPTPSTARRPASSTRFHLA